MLAKRIKQLHAEMLENVASCSPSYVFLKVMHIF